MSDGSMKRGPGSGNDMMRESLRELYGRHHAFVRRLCGRYVQNAADADDLTHDVLLKAARAWPGFGGGCAVTSWLYRVTTNHCRDHLRRHHARERALAHPSLAAARGFGEFDGFNGNGFDEGGVGNAGSGPEGGDPVAAAVLGALRAGLQGAERHMVYLRFDLGLPQNGIVRITGLPRAAVRRRLTRITLRAARLYESLQRRGPHGPRAQDVLDVQDVVFRW